jgi:AcrR family transcriptional regulator
MSDIENKQLDRRARRTRRQLKEAFFRLILEKGYDAVTIEDITGQADLGRTTFYLHYKDKEDLLVKSFDGIAAELLSRLPPSAFNVAHPPVNTGDGVMDAILVTFQHAAENAQLYQIILRGEGATRANRRIHAIIRQKAAELVSERLAQGQLRPQVPLDVFARRYGRNVPHDVLSRRAESAGN